MKLLHILEVHVDLTVTQDILLAFSRLCTFHGHPFSSSRASREYVENKLTSLTRLFSAAWLVWEYLEVYI